MKKTLLTICLAAITLTTFAQYYSDDAAVTFGVKGGGTFAVFRVTNSVENGASISGPLTSFHVGGFADLKITDDFSIQPALLFTGRGGTQNVNISIPDADPDIPTVSSTVNAKTTIYYAQVPVNFLYHFYNDYGSLFVGAGPYVAYGITGKTKGTSTFSLDDETISMPYNANVSFGNNEGQIKRIDYGVNAILGYKFDGGLLINASYDFGLAATTSQTIPTFDITSKTRIRAINVSVGFAF